MSPPSMEVVVNCSLRLFYCLSPQNSFISSLTPLSWLFFFWRSQLCFFLNKTTQNALSLWTDLGLVTSWAKIIIGGANQLFLFLSQCRPKISLRNTAISFYLLWLSSVLGMDWWRTIEVTIFMTLHAVKRNVRNDWRIRLVYVRMTRLEL